MKTKSSKKSSTKNTNKPFTISVHGDGIDIDARIEAGGGGGGKKKGKDAEPSAFENFLNQIAVKFGAAQAAAAAGSAGHATTEPHMTIEKFGTSLTDEQIEVIARSLTSEQLALFDQIMSFAGLTPWTDDKGQVVEDFGPDAVARVIKNATPDMLRTIIDLASIRLNNDPVPAPTADQAS